MIRILLLWSLLFLAVTTFGQVGVGTITPDPSAQLDVVSANKGLLIPRVTITSVVASPVAKGLVVYQTSGSEGFYYFDGANWQKLVNTNEVPSASYAYLSNLAIHLVILI